MKETVVRVARGSVLTGALLIVLALGGARAEPGKEFTPWMSLAEMHTFLEELDGDKPEGKNYWDRGNWLTGMEGEWDAQAGIPKYRLKYEPVPARRAYWWLWNFNQDEESFKRQVHQQADDGYALVSSNAYQEPGGALRFQGIWHKLVPLTGAAVLPPGNYRLTELRGQANPAPEVTIQIEGTKISGRTPFSTFEGSVRERFSGEMKKVSAEPELSSRRAPEQSLEREFFKRLEYSSWKEEDGKLRVIQVGKTVMRFEKETGTATEAK